MRKTLTASQLKQVLLLIEEAHKATTPAALRQCIVYGVGALMESSSCFWTELKADLFTTNTATATVVNVSDEDINVDEATLLFNRYAWQHPVIAEVINTGDSRALAFSDFLTRSEFNNLELYHLLCKQQQIEDQLSVCYVDNGYLKGLSVNRTTWGFTEAERSLLSYVARCVFPFYQALQGATPNETVQESKIELDMNVITQNYQILGITPREAEVLALIARGKSNKQIALAFRISHGTIKKHVENVYRRLEVNNRVSLTIKAMKIIQSAERK